MYPMKNWTIVYQSSNFSPECTVLRLIQTQKIYIIKCPRLYINTHLHHDRFDVPSLNIHTLFHILLKLSLTGKSHYPSIWRDFILYNVMHERLRNADTYMYYEFSICPVLLDLLYRILLPVSILMIQSF